MKNIKIKKNLCGGILTTVIGLVLWFILPYSIVSKMKHTTNAIGPDYLPKIIIGILIVSGVSLILKSLVFKKEETVTVELKGDMHAFLYMGSFILYVLLLPFLGFILSSVIFSAVSLMLMEDRKKLHYLYALILILVIFVSFRYGLGVELPALFL